MIEINNNNQFLIIGCGRLGASTANNLTEKNKNVTIIDINKEAFKKLSPSFSGLHIEGDGSDITLLKEINKPKIDVLIVVTDNDNINILIAQLAKTLFDIKYIIVRLYDYEKKVIYEDLGIQTISPSLLSVSEIDNIIFEGGKNE